MMIAIGWWLLVVLWETALAATALAAWHLLRPHAAARAQHIAALAAVTAIVTTAGLTPVMLTRLGPAATPSKGTSQQRPLSAGADISPTAAPANAASRLSSAITLDHLAALAGGAWLVVSAVLAIRFAGGWLTANRVRRNSVPVPDPSIAKAYTRLTAEIRLPRPVRLRQSVGLDAPAVIGWRDPTVIIPEDLTDRLSPEMVEALLAHELAHVQRGDYPVNLLQSAADTLLWFSPPYRWISQRVRDTREYCCDDIAVERCAGPRRVADALAMLAGLAARQEARPLLGAVGPRLIVRVRRLLRGHPMPRFAAARGLGLTLTLLLLISAGARVTTLAAARASRWTGGPVSGAAQNDIPYGFANRQPGSAVEINALRWSAAAPDGMATLINHATERVVGVSFVATVVGRGSPLHIFTSPTHGVDIPPGSAAEIAPAIMSADQFTAATTASGAGVQVFFGLERVRYANGSEWRVTPNSAATTGESALGLRTPDIPRSMVAAPGTPANRSSSMCHDDVRGDYSPGARVAVREEPGTYVRCVDGLWLDTAPHQAATPAPTVTLEITLPAGPRPTAVAGGKVAATLTVSVGEAATMQLNAGGHFAFVPTIAAGSADTINLEIFDLETTPRTRLDGFPLTLGGDAVQSSTQPALGIRVLRISGGK